MQSDLLTGYCVSRREQRRSLRTNVLRFWHLWLSRQTYGYRRYILDARSAFSARLKKEIYYMAGLYGLSRSFYAYLSDNGTTYQVALTNDDAASGGFSTSVSPGFYPVFPRGWVMRKLYGIASSGVRTKIPVASASGSTWTSPVTFTKNSIPFIAMGAIGERRINRS